MRSALIYMELLIVLEMIAFLDLPRVLGCLGDISRKAGGGAHLSALAYLSCLRIAMLWSKAGQRGCLSSGSHESHG